SAAFAFAGSVLIDLAPDFTDIQPHQLRRGIDAAVRARFPDACEAEHHFIEPAVARIHLDEEIGAVIMQRPVDEDEVEQSGEPRPRRTRCVECEFRELAKLRSWARAEL